MKKKIPKVNIRPRSSGSCSLVISESKFRNYKKPTLKLIGEGITLRPLKISDAKDIYLNIQNKKIAENTLRIPWPYRLKNAKSFIKESQKSQKKKTGLVFGIELKDKEQIVGCVGLDKLDFEHKNAELGYWLGVKYWNQGIMTDAGKLVLNFAFLKLKLHRVWAGVFSDNPASQRVLEKLGFKKEGFSRQAHWRFGRWRDDIHYGLLANDFLKK